MNKFAIAVHGGANYWDELLNHRYKETELGLAKAAEAGYEVLERGGTALEAVVAAICLLEDNPLYNAGRGSALNSECEVEMDASIMDGEFLDAGAVSMVTNVKNPIILAKEVMEKSNHVFFSGHGALKVAKKSQLILERDAYFITEYQYDQLRTAQLVEPPGHQLNKRKRGTVGAVALDQKGNIAAGTSTGGTTNCSPGRIGDSCVIGAGCYANNQTCAVSGTGDGEFLITGVVAHSISMLVEGGMDLQKACDHVLHERNKGIDGIMGVIAVNPKGEIGISFTSETMKRAWKISGDKLNVKIE